jgi:hypothetical protein
VLDHLDISYFATAADFGIGVESVWEVLPDDPPSSFATKWDVENPLPSRASTLITYTHDLEGWPTHELTQPLNLAYNGCFDSANGWGEWSYSFPSGTANASFWAPRIGHDRPGAWVLHGYAQVFQWLEGLEPDTEYGLSFYVYHPYKAGDKRNFKLIGRLIDGQPDLNYVYKLSLAQDDVWEHVSVRARTDAQGRLYAAVQAGNGNAAWLAIDDLMVWAEPDQGIAPLEGDCGTTSCDLLHHGPVDVQVSDLHLGLSPEGWPSPNPIAITATWDLEDELPSGWEGYVRLKVENLLQDRTRVYLVPEDGESKSRFELGTEYNLDGSLLDPAAWYQIGEEFDGYYYYHPSSGALYTYKKVRSSDLYGTAHWKIWVQPSEEAKLSLTVEVFHEDEAGRPRQEPVTDPPNLWDRTCVQVPQADVHPVVFVHGILGSMPPKNDIFYDWPHEEGNMMFSGGALLEPWLDSYTPMMDNWVKMGYEPGESMFIVTYDWMQSNRVSAAWLYDKLLEINGLGTPAYVDNSQVDLVVHSMGGLVSRAYLEGLANPDPSAGGGYPYANNVDKVIFIASPHRGFPITYRTWEGVTWEEYLGTEVFPESEADAHPVPPLLENYVQPGMLRTMDEVLWPFMILKRYLPNSDQPCSWQTSSGFGHFNGNLGWFETGMACPKKVLYYYSHSSDPGRGVWSLPEMLPPVSDGEYPEAAARPIPPYLSAAAGEQPCGSDGDYPCGVQVNPLLETFGLNAPDRVSQLIQHLAEDVYVLYGGDTRTDAEYTVVEPGITIGWPLFPVPWTNGAPAGEEQQEGDNLIPTYSTQLHDSGQGLLGAVLDEWHEIKADLEELPAGHKGIMYHPRAQRAVGWTLTGLGERLGDENSDFTFPFFSTYKPPRFWYDNQNTFWCLAWWSPVDGLVTDPLGRRIGSDPVTGEYVNEIPGAFYSGNGTDVEFLLLPGAPEGDYTVTAVGTGAGEYALTAYRVDAGGVRLTGLLTGTATPGQTLTHSLAYSLPATPLFSDDLESGAGSWTAAGSWTLTTTHAHSPDTAWSSDAGGGATAGQPVTLTLNPTINLSGARMARLTLWHSYTLTAGGQTLVQLSPDEGATWETVARRQGDQVAWTPLETDLTPLLLAGEQQVRLRLVLEPAASYERWRVDDVAIQAILPSATFGVPFLDDVEGWRRWDASGAWGAITGTVHSGHWAWHGTGDGTTLALAGPLDLSGTLAPQLSFWYTGTLPAPGAGLVEVSSDAGQSWTPVLTVSGSVTGWTQASINLTGFAGEGVHLRLRLAGSGAIWTVDDVTVYDAPPAYSLPFGDDMETTNHWWATNAWETVTSTAFVVGPESQRTTKGRKIV